MKEDLIKPSVGERVRFSYYIGNDLFIAYGFWDGTKWNIEKGSDFEELREDAAVCSWSYEPMTLEQVNHPAHYNSGKLECIDVMLDVFGAHDTIAFCKLNAFKYLFRAGKKADNSERQDLEKAEWYIKKAVELIGQENLKQ